MRTRDQKRADHAYEKVEKVPKASQTKFKTLALKFPAMVLQCGLLQTLAFYEKKDNALAFEPISEWLCTKAGLPWQTQNGRARERLSHESTNLQLYRMATREALAYGSWLKRGAEVILAEVKAE